MLSLLSFYGLTGTKVNLTTLLRGKEKRHYKLIKYTVTFFPIYNSFTLRTKWKNGFNLSVLVVNWKFEFNWLVRVWRNLHTVEIIIINLKVLLDFDIKYFSIKIEWKFLYYKIILRGIRRSKIFKGRWWVYYQ